MTTRLIRDDPTYIDMALKFVAHFLWIAVAMDPAAGDSGLWDEEDGFYYDVMRMPDGVRVQLKVRSLVGLLPMCAATVFDGELIERHPQMWENILAFASRFADSIPALANLPGPNPECRRLLSLVDEPRLRRILSVMLDEDEFLGPHGIRAISRRHLEHPVEFDWGGQHYEVRYLPAESDTGMFGGNSNWRGPVWFPMFGGIEKFQDDPNWHNLLLFHEYFHGDNGAGIGASHQTGWTGTVAVLPLFAGVTAQAAQTVN
jgi:hypothetical protein